MPVQLDGDHVANEDESLRLSDGRLAGVVEALKLYGGRPGSVIYDALLGLDELQARRAGETNGERCKHGWWKNRCGECVAETLTLAPRSVEGLKTYPYPNGDLQPVKPVLGTPNEISDASLASLIKFENQHDDFCAFVELWERRGAVKTGAEHG